MASVMPHASPSKDFLIMPTLDEAPVGATVTIGNIDDADTAAMIMRMGLSEGTPLTLLARIPGGPMVVMQGEMEVALGRELCRQIQVTLP